MHARGSFRGDITTCTKLHGWLQCLYFRIWTDGLWQVLHDGRRLGECPLRRVPKRRPETLVTQTNETVGMIPRAVEQVFRVTEELKSKGWEYTLEGQFLEIVRSLPPPPFPFRPGISSQLRTTPSIMKRSTTSSEKASSTRRSTRSNTRKEARLMSPTSSYNHSAPPHRSVLS